MIVLITFVKFIAFPERTDALLSPQNNQINVESSGSMGVYHSGKCHQTYPNNTLISDEALDWCSNIAKDKSDNPWIIYGLTNKKMRLTGFSIRNGCCRYLCCCTTDNTYIDYDCCCRLYSYSLQGSNDKKTWTTIYKVKKDSDILFCQNKIYEFPKTESFNFIRFILDEELPGCPACLQINQLQLYGETVGAPLYIQADSDDEESVSIIGKIVKTIDN
jgi:hypothetical protein